jgi:hypothetical protein
MDFDLILNAMCFVNMKQELCVNLDFISYVNDENIANVIVFVFSQITTLLQSQPKIVINLYLNGDMQSAHMKYIGSFFELFKTKIPSDNLERMYIHTKTKYRAIASLLVNLADKKTRNLIVINS